MSVHISSAVWRESKASGGPFLVLVSLADQANDDGLAFPRIEQIAARCRVSRSSVTRHLKTLVELGELQVVARHQKGQASEYWITIGVATPGQSDVRSAASAPARPQVNLTPTPGQQCGDPQVTGDVTPTSTVTRQEPSLEPSVEPSLKNTSSSADAADGPNTKPADQLEVDFDLFWSRYPRKVGKGQARRAYRTARKQVDEQTITDALRIYVVAASHLPPDRVRHAATWLNGEPWHDDPDAIAPITRMPDRRQRHTDDIFDAALARARTRDPVTGLPLTPAIGHQPERRAL